jgi:hypothetical protein
VTDDRSARHKYETLAARYFETSDRRHLLEGWGLAIAMWWTTSTGGKRDGVSDAVRAYLDVCTKDLPKYWLLNFIDERDYCRQCGQRFQVDNMSMCTNCYDGYCWRCVGGAEYHPNGNHRCFCGGELVG